MLLSKLQAALKGRCHSLASFSTSQVCLLETTQSSCLQRMLDDGHCSMPLAIVDADIANTSMALSCMIALVMLGASASTW